MFHQPCAGRGIEAPPAKTLEQREKQPPVPSHSLDDTICSNGSQATPPSSGQLVTVLATFTGPAGPTLGVNEAA